MELPLPSSLSVEQVELVSGAGESAGGWSPGGGLSAARVCAHFCAATDGMARCACHCPQCALKQAQLLQCQIPAAPAARLACVLTQLIPKAVRPKMSHPCTSVWCCKVLAAAAERQTGARNQCLVACPRRRLHRCWAPQVVAGDSRPPQPLPPAARCWPLVVAAACWPLRLRRYAVTLGWNLHLLCGAIPLRHVALVSSCCGCVAQRSVRCQAPCCLD